MVPFAICALTSLLNAFIHNAAAIQFTPIAIGLADQLGVIPLVRHRHHARVQREFSTPIGYQTNTLVWLRR